MSHIPNAAISRLGRQRTAPGARGPESPHMNSPCHRLSSSERLFLNQKWVSESQTLKAQGRVYMPLTQLSPWPGYWERQAHAARNVSLAIYNPVDYNSSKAQVQSSFSQCWVFKAPLLRGQEEGAATLHHVSWLNRSNRAPLPPDRIH